MFRAGLLISTAIAALSGAAAAGTIAATYIPATTAVGSFAPYIVWGARRLMSGYTGNMFRLTNSGKTATLDVPALTQNNADQNSQLPDYSAIVTWIAANCGGATTAFVDTLYDQSGGGATGTRNATQATVANMPVFDPAQLLNGCSPILFDGQPAAGGGTVKRKFMSYTDATGYNRQALTIIDALDPVWTHYPNVYWSIGGNVQMFSNSNATPATVSHANVSSAAFGSPTFQGKMLRSQPQVTGVVYASADVKMLTRDSIQANGSTPYPNSVSGSTALTLSDSTPFGGSGGGSGAARRWAFVLYNAALGDTDHTTIHDKLVTINSIPTTFTSTLVTGDDSVEQGYLTILLKAMTAQFTGANALTETTELFNIAIPGQTLATAASTFSGISTLLLADSAITARGKKNFWAIQGKINDRTSLDATVYSTYIGFVTAAKNAGWTVVGDTGTPITDATTNKRTTLFNMAQRISGKRSLANNVAATGLWTAQHALPLTEPDVVVPTYFDSVLGGSTESVATARTTDTTIYVDGVHATDLGQTYRAACYSSAINAALSNIATPTFASYGASIFVNTPTATLTNASLAGLGTITSNDLVIFHLVTGNTNLFQPSSITLGGAANGETPMASIFNTTGAIDQIFWKQLTAAEIANGTFSASIPSGSGTGAGGFYVHLIKNASRASVLQAVSSGVGLSTIDFTGYTQSPMSKGTLIIYDVDLAISPGTPPTGFTALASTNGTATRTYAIAGEFGGYVNGTALSVTGLPAATKRGILLDVI